MAGISIDLIMDYEFEKVYTLAILWIVVTEYFFDHVFGETNMWFLLRVIRHNDSVLLAVYNDHRNLRLCDILHVMVY